MKVIKENTISKARRFMMFNLSIFDCRTVEERKLYGEYEKAKKKDEKQIIKEKLLHTVETFSETREIDKNVLFEKDGEAKISKLIAGFENECVRLSESLCICMGTIV